MASNFCLFFIITSCFILINAYPSIIADNERFSIDDIDEIFALQRVARGFLSPANQYVEIIPKNRQSFGRKHHWDAFFGRRR